MIFFLQFILAFFIMIIITTTDESERILDRRLRNVYGRHMTIDTNQQETGHQFIINKIQDNTEEVKENIFEKIKIYANSQFEIYKASLKVVLNKAGLRADEDIRKVICVNILGGIVIGLIIALQVESNYPELVESNSAFILCIILCLPLGFYGSSYLVTNMIERTAQERRTLIENGIPDLLDLMVICSEAGFDIQKIFQRTAKEIGISNITLADELRRTNAEFKLSSNFYQVLKNLEERTESVKIQSICNIIIQSIEMGSSLTDSLKILSQEIRNERALFAEEQAGKIPNKITVPLLIFIMPCLFIIILAPMLLKASGSFSGQ